MEAFSNKWIAAFLFSFLFMMVLVQPLTTIFGAGIGLFLSIMVGGGCGTMLCHAVEKMHEE
jgi:hypothetical protein